MTLDGHVLRYAAEPQGFLRVEALELLTLSGALGVGGVHLHVSVSDAWGSCDAGLCGAHYGGDGAGLVAGLVV